LPIPVYSTSITAGVAGAMSKAFMSSFILNLSFDTPNLSNNL